HWRHTPWAAVALMVGTLSRPPAESPRRQARRSPEEGGRQPSKEGVMTRVSVWQGAPPQLAPPAVPVAPLISVRVPVRNEEAFIKETLTQLLTQKYDPDRYEVIVADGQSTDATCEIVREFQLDHPNLFLHSNPKYWSSAGRNVAVRASRGDIVVVV